MAPDGFHVVTASKGFNGVGCEARLWDLRGPAAPVQVAAAAAPAAGGWGGQAPAAVRQFAGHSQDAAACVFLPPSNRGRGLTFATASKDASVRVWDAASGQALCAHTEVGCGAYTSLAVVPPAPGAAGGPRLAAGCSGGVFVYAIDAAAGKLTTLLRSNAALTS